MTTKHTPGPWYTVNTEIRTNNQSHVYDTIAECNMIIGGLPKNECLANAKLMAAAPDLLEILQKAEFFISGFEDDDTQENINELLAEIRNSITKAESNALLEAQVPLSDKEIKSYLSFYTGVLLGFISKHGLNEILKKEQGEVLVNNIFSLVYEGKINT